MEDQCDAEKAAAINGKKIAHNKSKWGSFWAKSYRSEVLEPETVTAMAIEKNA